MKIDILKLYTTMLRIRLFEEKVAELVAAEKIICPCHLYIGQEAVAAGVCAELKKDDYVFSTHRSHGHYLAKGGSMNALMAEILGRATGCSKGRGGSMHIVSPEHGLPGSSAIVAGTIPLAVGAALANSLKKNKGVAVAFFSDGATNEGVFYESLNLAALKRLPVLFVCENNLYSTHMPISACLYDTDISKKARALGLPAECADGNDVSQVYSVAEKVLRKIRGGKGPAFIEYMTYRWRGHVGPNYDVEKGLRAQEEVDYWISRCPIKKCEEDMLRKKVVSKKAIRQIRDSTIREVNASLVFAGRSPYPDASGLHKYLFAGPMKGL